MPGHKSQPLYVGIDFGTTNSAFAIARGDEPAQLVALPMGISAASSTWRTVLYFESGGRLSAGGLAIERYRETQGDGRLVQSIKSHLASESFARTTVFGRRWTLPDMIAAYLRQIRQAAEATWGDLGNRCVVGRPVTYVGADNAQDDERALARMTEALASAGFTDVVFEFEPVAAAAAYAMRLPKDETIVVADFGGGTSDFSVVKISAGGNASQILATGGIGISGDAFDARIIDEVIAPAFGKGSRYQDEMGGQAVVPSWLYNNLRRWHYLSFLKEATTQKLLYRIGEGALDPVGIDRLRTLIDDDLGLVLHQAVEGTKVAVSKVEATQLVLRHGLDFTAEVSRQHFEQWIAPDVAAIDTVLTKVLAQAGVAASDVDKVFATGGTSLVPAVRQWLINRFGQSALVGGEELTSVASGLALRARQHFSAGR